jgi:hypothetical protein
MACSKFDARKKINQTTMGHHENEHHEVHEAEQNEIGAPVTFAIVCLALAVLLIYFLG